jgi:hypothetical protein
MQDPISIQPRRPTGGLADHVEIYLPEQVMIVFHADRPALVAHVSTGELRDGATGFTPWYENAAEYRETITIDTDINGNPLPEPEQKAVIGWSYTPPGRVRGVPQDRGPPQRPARRHVGPDLHQPGHRHPRRAQRTARAGVARLHPGVEYLGATCSRSSISATAC